jgi:hypothetical protein
MGILQGGMVACPASISQRVEKKVASHDPVKAVRCLRKPDVAEKALSFK